MITNPHIETKYAIAIVGVAVFLAAAFITVLALRSDSDSVVMAGSSQASTPFTPPTQSLVVEPSVDTEVSVTTPTSSDAIPSLVNSGPREGNVVRAYDTAWEFAYRAPDGDIDKYLDHLQQSGFDGFWFLVLPFGATLAGRTDTNFGGNIATKVGGNVVLTDAYTQRIDKILDGAQKRNLKVGVVTAWARANICRSGGNNITGANAEAYGKQLGTLFNKPAVEYWVLGGDSEGCDMESTLIKIETGLRSAGANQKAAFHTGINDKALYSNSAWNDAQAVQTGHCQNSDGMFPKIKAVVDQTDNEVFLAEPRYYQISPPWNGCLHQKGVGRPVLGADIASDVRAGIRAGVDAVFFGDILRYQWCLDNTGISADGYTCGSQGVSRTFGTEGEKAFLAAVQGK